MAHECPECGQACYCDGEDNWFDEAPIDCRHALNDEAERDDEDE